MIKRPKPTDTEQEILAMQNEFLAEKSKNVNFQPAAKLVKFDKSKGLSQFAQRRAEYHKKIHSQASPTTSANATKTQETPPIKFILGNIVERMGAGVPDESVHSSLDDDRKSDGFPKASRIDKNVKVASSKKKSLFALTQQTKDTQKLDDAIRPPDDKLDFGSDSIMLDNADAQAIHRENATFLMSCGEDEVLKEQQRLLGTLDSTLVKFLQEKRKKKLERINESSAVQAAAAPSNDIEMTEAPNQAPELDVLQGDASKSWLHFDVIETDKLEWMRDLPASMPELKPGQTYEARFDWKGVLLPFRLNENEAASRELFLHGDDADRPGYTMQELFRLARSTVMQQRLSALAAIGGILSIYNQGYYDGIFKLPISKIFFLLRYAFDDNTPAMLEVTAKALATLIYNETDEILLDTTFDCSLDFVEPTLEVKHDDDSDKPIEPADLSEQMAQMNLKTNVCEANVNESASESSLSSLNDFHLAETDLIKCLLRTNILQRVSYILTSLNLENSTNLSCIKILIRLARTSKAVAESIVDHAELLKTILAQFDRIPQTKDIATIRLLNTAKIVSLKLLRVICAYDSGVYENRLRDLGLDAILKKSIFVQENGITIETVKLQIEAMRCTKIITVITKSDALFDETVPALRYTLEWIYQFVIFESEEHFLFRQCASALIALLGARNSINASFEKLPLCFSKWFMAAAKYSNLELSQITLLATCLNAINIPERFGDFLHIYFGKFLNSTTYLAICQTLSKSSGVLSTLRQRQQDHKPLPHLHSIVFNARNSPVFIVSEKPTIYLLSSIVRFFNSISTTIPIGSSDWLNDELIGYAERFAKNSSWSFSMNWFLRREITFVLDLLRSTAFQQRADKRLQLTVAYKVLGCLDDTQLNEILQIFSRFIFKHDLYEHKSDVTSMDEWKSLYAKVIVEHFLNSLHGESAPSPSHYEKTPMLSTDWPCMPLLKMCKTPDSLRGFNVPERDAIHTTLSFLLLQNANDIKVLNITEQLLYTMLAFLGKENSFLDADVSQLLTGFVRATFTDPKQFDFDAKLNQKFNFENLYISFLDQFQGCSYGDKTFGALVMVPLAQKHNIKWRHMLWSEHVHVLRFVACTEEELIGTIDDYLEPPESDKLLLKSYYQAINSHILLQNSVPHRIAEHHVNAYKTKLNPRTSRTISEEP